FKTAGLIREMPTSFIEISPELAKERGMQEGAEVKLASKVGAVTAIVHVTGRVAGNELCITLTEVGNSAVNSLTDNSVDKDSNTPAYKEITVKMEVITKKGKSPLPSHNHRRGNRQPQISVQVEKKWARDDYIFPGSRVKQDG